MKTKKLYTVPEVLIVKVSPHLMQSLSIEGETTSDSLKWDDDADAVDAGDGW